MLLWPGSVFVLGGHDDRRFLHSARFVRTSDVEQYGVPPEAIFEGGMRWALVLRWGRHKDLFYLDPQREWALAPADDGCEWERLWLAAAFADRQPRSKELHRGHKVAARHARLGKARELRP